MKVLFFNPELNAQHKACATLAEQGHVILFARTVEEAWKIIQFHGVSLDLAVIHREGWTAGASSEAGLKLIEQIKADPIQTDLPIIMTSWRWNGKDFTQHQQSSTGVNAYLKWPTAPEELLKTIQIVMGNDLPTSVSDSIPSIGTSPALEPPSAPASTGSSSAVQLEQAVEEVSQGSINLEAPDFAGSLQSTNEATAMTENQLEPHERLTLENPSAAPSSVTELLQQNVVSLDPTEASAESVAQEPDISLSPPSIETGTGTGGIQFDLGAPASSLEATTVNGSASDEPMVIGEATTGGPASASALEISEMEISVPESSAGRELQTENELGSELSDSELAGDMPYLFKSKGESSPAYQNPVLAFSEPVGDAVVPGGAANTPDTEVLKKYLLLREQDVAVLSNQLAAAREQIAGLEKSLREERGKSADLNHDLSDRQRKLDVFESEKRAELAALQAELEELRFQHKTKTDKVRVLELQVREASSEIEKMKERVRTDIRKIRVREKELENRLEIVKKDSEALLAARETKMTELKRKLDLLEFNMDLLQDQYTREKETSALLRERLSKAAQVVRVAGGLLGPQQALDEVTQSLSVPPSPEAGVSKKVS